MYIFVFYCQRVFSRVSAIVCTRVCGMWERVRDFRFVEIYACDPAGNQAFVIPMGGFVVLHDPTELSRG